VVLAEKSQSIGAPREAKAGGRGEERGKKTRGRRGGREEPVRKKNDGATRKMTQVKIGSMTCARRPELKKGGSIRGVGQCGSRGVERGKKGQGGGSITMEGVSSLIPFKPRAER